MLPALEFSKDSGKKDGLRSLCKACDKARVIAWQRANPERTNARNAKWKAANPELRRAGKARWRARYPEKERLRGAAWRRNNPEKISGYNAKQRSTPQGKLRSNVSRAIRLAIFTGAKRGRHTFELLGYAAEELIEHLEARFLPGMSWENYGRGGWHIDHKIPLVAFNYQTPEHADFKRAWALSNLQPLWERDNCRKHSRLSEPFQPSLAL